MKQAHRTVTIQTRGAGLYEFTDAVADFVRGEKLETGLLTCFIPIASAG